MLAVTDEQQTDPGERFQVTGFTQERLARSLSDGAQLAHLPREKLEQAVGFNPIREAQRDGFHT